MLLNKYEDTGKYLTFINGSKIMIEIFIRLKNKNKSENVIN